MILRLVLAVLAVALIFAGLIILPLPIPFGAILIFIGLTILISSNTLAARWLKNRRIRNARLNNIVCTIETRLPGRLADIIRRTAP
jgi:Kef-type K+ transport system membrane component KefB